MSENNSGNGQDTPAAAEQQAGGEPQLSILGQYLKDLSFENPNAPQSMTVQGQPQINISVNVNANQMGENDYEVSLELEAHAEHEKQVIFHVELNYAGVFRLVNIPEEMMGPAVLIECPRMLFPFARRILADATRDGGFPPLMLDPIDFAAMYAQRMQQAEAAGDGAGEGEQQPS